MSELCARVKSGHRSSWTLTPLPVPRLMGTTSERVNKTSGTRVRIVKEPFFCTRVSQNTQIQYMYTNLPGITTQYPHHMQQLLVSLRTTYVVDQPRSSPKNREFREPSTQIRDNYYLTLQLKSQEKVFFSVPCLSCENDFQHSEIKSKWRPGLIGFSIYSR